MQGAFLSGVAGTGPAMTSGGWDALVGRAWRRCSCEQPRLAVMRFVAASTFTGAACKCGRVQPILTVKLRSPGNHRRHGRIHSGHPDEGGTVSMQGAFLSGVAGTSPAMTS